MVQNILSSWRPLRLGSKDTTAAQILSVYENLELAEPKKRLYHRDRG